VLKLRYQLLIVCVTVLVAFSPALFAGFSFIDDDSMETGYQGVERLDLGNVFIPAHGGGLYYRPLIALSYRLDKLLFRFSPGIMHLENILLHIVNTLLVYFIVLRVLPPPDRTRSMLPLFVSLVFALHPVNAESVNWISGRSDVLAGSFLFASMLSTLVFQEDRQRIFGVVAFLSFLGGVLTKETSLAFFPGVLMLVKATDGPHADRPPVTGARQREGEHHPFLLLTGAVLALAIFFFLRTTAFTSNTGRIGLTIRAISDDWINSLFVILRAFGFYMKKIIYPYPLNFAIIEIDPLYEILAVPLLMVTAYVASRRTTLSAIFTTGILLITPSFLIAFGQIAWTPYAERYLYLASAFLSIAGIITVVRLIPPRAVSAVKIGSMVLLLLLVSAMFQRSLVWQDDMKLIADTVEKTPDSKVLRAIYALKLVRAGEYARAKEQIDKGEQIYELVYDPRFDFIRAYMFYRQGNMTESLKIIEGAVEKTKGRSPAAVEYLVMLLQEKKSASHSLAEKRILERSIFRHTMRLFSLTGDPHLLYDLGVSAEGLGERQRALRLYRQAEKVLPEGDGQRLSVTRKIEAITRTNGAHHAQ
jgi:tetratricopeptide (TPR) repeat protein